MLEGIDANTIIVGAYTDRRGGVCPMLAAHRHGGRTDLLAFAHAWDRFCERQAPAAGDRARAATCSRRTSRRACYDAEQATTSRGVIATHQAAARDRRAREAAAGVGAGLDAPAGVVARGRRARTSASREPVV